MAERPLLMSGPMVRALLSGVKTETRRVAVKHYRDWKPGDRIWMREAFCPHYGDRLIMPPDGHAYKADWNRESMRGIAPEPCWTPGIHMPKAAARIWRTLGEIRVEQLQDIDEEGAVREGMMTLQPQDLIEMGASRRDVFGNGRTSDRLVIDAWAGISARDRFRLVIDAISGADVWDSNPDVAVLTFREDRE